MPVIAFVSSPLMALPIICILLGSVGFLVYLFPFIRSLSWQHSSAEIIENRIEIIDMGRNGFHKFEYPEYEFKHDSNWFRYCQRKLVKWSLFKITIPMTDSPKFVYKLNSQIKICFKKSKPNHSFILPLHLHTKFIFSTALIFFGAYLCQKS